MALPLDMIMKECIIYVKEREEVCFSLLLFLLLLSPWVALGTQLSLRLGCRRSGTGTRSRFTAVGLGLLVGLGLAGLGLTLTAG
jgi:hypothetical protein